MRLDDGRKILCWSVHEEYFCKVAVEGSGRVLV